MKVKKIVAVLLAACLSSVLLMCSDSGDDRQREEYMSIPKGVAK